MNIKNFNSSEEIAEKVSSGLLESLNKAADTKENFFLAISGGSTPKILFKKLTEAPYSEQIKWQLLHIFWVDERCVPPGDMESNFGETKRILFDKINFPEENIHRIRGEEKPGVEIFRYSGEIKQYVTFKNNCPSFNWILLGMGADGHTASLFPNSDLEQVADGICGTAIHPVTGQNRISLTEQVINNAARITFLITGKDKAGTLNKIKNDTPEARDFPAAKIVSVYNNLEWYVDKDALTR